MKKNEKGFSAVEVLLVLVVIGLLGGAGWYVWQSKNKNDQSTTSTSQADSKRENNKEAPKDEVATAKYLTIKEWGVRLKLSDNIANATYRFEKPDYQWVYLTTPRLNELAQQTPECSAAKESITLNRAKPGDDRFGSPWKESELQEIGTKWGDYYYFGEGGQPCFTDKQDFQMPEEISQIRVSLGNAIKTIEKL